jgi:hypothetical protein
MVCLGMKCQKFHLGFQKWFVVGIFKVSRVVCCRCFGLSNLAFFDLATFWAMF